MVAVAQAVPVAMASSAALGAVPVAVAVPQSAAVSAAPAGAVNHWSKVHLGAEFSREVASHGKLWIPQLSVTGTNRDD